MKKILLLLLLPLLNNVLLAQDKESAENLIKEGISLHDEGRYEEAILKYDKALELDKDNLTALAEKAYSLLSLTRYDDAISCCLKAIEKYPGDEGLKIVYVSLGNAYDGKKDALRSLATYDEAIKVFPDFFLLHFNKGITLTGQKNYDEALLCFRKAVSLNPKHASSHNAIARLLHDNNRIASLLAFSRFMIIEPEGGRAKSNLELIEGMMKGSAEKTGRKSVTINITSDILGDTTADGKANENSFATTELILLMTAALDYDKSFKKETPPERFRRKFDVVCSSLDETRKDNHGFYWEYYAPYFIELKEKGFTETLSYLVYASSGDPSVEKWIKEHKEELIRFYEWSNSYAWK